MSTTGEPAKRRVVTGTDLYPRPMKAFREASLSVIVSSYSSSKWRSTLHRQAWKGERTCRHGYSDDDVGESDKT